MVERVLTAVALLPVVLVVHEVGHYVAAALAGIPASDRRFVWLADPPHVALPHDGDWVGPREPSRFGAAFFRYDPAPIHAALYNASGHLAQVVVLVPLALGLAALAAGGIPLPGWLPRQVVIVSAAFTAVAVVHDVAATASRGSAFGDVTNLWGNSPWYVVGTLGVFAAGHGGALWLLG